MCFIHLFSEDCSDVIDRLRCMRVCVCVFKCLEVDMGQIYERTQCARPGQKISGEFEISEI